MEAFMDAYILGQKNYTQNPDLNQFQMHTHEFYEIYCFLSGSAKYYVEGTIYPLKPGDIIIMKKSEAHSLLINRDIPYERIVINFNANALLENFADKFIPFLDSRPFGEKNRYPAADFQETAWLYYLEKICISQDMATKRLYLTILMEQLYENYGNIHSHDVPQDNIRDIIEYINQHLTDDLSLDVLCTQFYISKSHLNRKFRQITGSTVWNYIQTKRILLAKEFLQNSTHPTEVYSKCGFQDYSSFFRAYTSKFHTSPKQDYVKKLH